MNYRKNKNDRLLRRKILLFFSKVKIKGSNFSSIQIIQVIGIILMLVSIFIPWFNISYNNTIEGVFSQITGIHGPLIIFFVATNLFILFSRGVKQKVKLLLNHSFNESTFSLFSGVILLLFSINSIITLGGLQIISSEITFHSGIIINCIGSFFFFIGSIAQHKKDSKLNNFLYLNESPNQSHLNKNKQKNITKLPF